MSCAAIGCTSSQSNKSGITFHRFPKDVNLQQAWIKAVGRKNWQPSACSRLCSNHFRESDFDRSSPFLTLLKKNSVPSVFSNLPKDASLVPVEDVESEKTHNRISLNKKKKKGKKKLSSSNEGNFISKRKNVPSPKPKVIPLYPRKKCLICINDDEDTSLFKFPKDSKLLARWADFCSLPITDIRPSHCLCHKHFHEDLIFKKKGDSGKRKLRKDAVPSIYPEKNRKRLITENDAAGEFEDHSIMQLSENTQTSAMRKRCCACGNNSSNASYFSFPTDPFKKEEWKQFLDLNFEVPASFKVCHKHFKDEDFVTFKMGSKLLRKLKVNVVPSVLCHKWTPNKAKVEGTQRCYFCHKEGGNRSYFKFPKDPELRLKWADFCEDPIEMILPSHRLCSNHFSPDVIVDNSKIGGRRSLQKNAIPTIKRGDDANYDQYTCNDNQQQKDNESYISDEKKSSYAELHADNRKEYVASYVFNPEKNIVELSAIPVPVIKFSTSATSDNEQLPNRVVCNESETNNHQKLTDETTTSIQSDVPSNVGFQIPKYIGHVRMYHLTTLDRARTCFAFAQRVIRKKNNQIKILKRNNKKLQSKVFRLEKSLSEMNNPTPIDDPNSITIDTRNALVLTVDEIALISTLL